MTKDLKDKGDKMSDLKINVLKKLLEEIEKKNSWGKNELKELILKLMVEHCG
jgi:hypothetical protein